MLFEETNGCQYLLPFCFLYFKFFHFVFFLSFLYFFFQLYLFFYSYLFVLLLFFSSSISFIYLFLLFLSVFQSISFCSTSFFLIFHLIVLCFLFVRCSTALILLKKIPIFLLFFKSIFISFLGNLSFVPYNIHFFGKRA